MVFILLGWPFGGLIAAVILLPGALTLLIGPVQGIPGQQLIGLLLLALAL